MTLNDLPKHQWIGSIVRVYLHRHEKKRDVDRVIPSKVGRVIGWGPKGFAVVEFEGLYHGIKNVKPQNVEVIEAKE